MSISIPEHRGHRTNMPTETIPLLTTDDARTLFGTQDAHLRRIRDSVGVNIVLRGDQLVLDGPPEQVQRGRDVIEQLQSIVATEGELAEADVIRILGRTASPPAAPEASIDLFEKARRVVPRTPGQAEYVEAIRTHDLVFCRGPAGCGKTYLAVAMAVNALRRELVRKIVLVRPAVEAGERLGFLPGDLLAKVNPFLRPLLDAMNEMLDFEQVKRYMEADVIEIVPLAFMRGRTLNQTFIILDEAQNTTITQMKMFLTRMGESSRIVATGDVTQVDLPANVSSGLVDAIGRLGDIDGVAVVDLTERDIVRHRLVRAIVRAYAEGPRKPARTRRN
jgi:phosphate starvation-inducible PhoH-like protein